MAESEGVCEYKYKYISESGLVLRDLFSVRPSQNFSGICRFLKLIVVAKAQVNMRKTEEEVTAEKSKNLRARKEQGTKQLEKEVASQSQGTLQVRHYL